MKTPLISIPLKVTHESDWKHPLRSYISQIYGSYHDFDNQITLFDKLRQDMRGAGKDETGRDLLYRYYGQLELLDLRIPLGVNESNAHYVKMTFTWSDCLSGEFSTQQSVAFEKANVLFNLGAIYSHIGCKTDSIKVAYASFQSSAGIFAFIAENFLYAPSDDLNQESVSAISRFMLAQAQEMFLVNLLENITKKQYSLAAKLAIGAAKLFNQAAELLTNTPWRDFDWDQASLAKSHYYTALANKFQAIHLTESKPGEAIAYCTQASTNLKLAKNEASSSLHDILKELDESLQHMSTELDKDNTYIYHQLVPQTSALATISGVETAKPTGIKDQDISRIVGADLFENLIPLDILEKSSVYSEEQAKLIRKEGAKVEIADQELASELDFLKLPQKVSEFKQYLNASHSSGFKGYDNGSVDASVNSYAAEVSSVPKIDISRLQSQSTQIRDELRQLETKLSTEESEYNENKSKFGNSWTQYASDFQNAGIYAEIRRAKQSLADALDSDYEVSKLIKEYEPEIYLLTKGADSLELQKMFELEDASQSQGNINEVSLLDLDTSSIETTREKLTLTVSLLSKLNQIKKERQNVYEELKQQVHKDDISSLLILNKKNPDVNGTLFENELAKFKPYQSRLSDCIRKQNTTLTDLKNTWNIVLNDKTIKSRQQQAKQQNSQHERTIQRFESAFKNWVAAKDAYQKGLTFYEELNSLVRQLESNVDSFVSQRKKETQSLKEKIENSQNNNNNNSNVNQSRDLADRFASLNFNSGTTALQPQRQSSFASSSFNSPSSNPIEGPPSSSYGSIPRPNRHESTSSQLSSNTYYAPQQPTYSYNLQQPQQPQQQQQLNYQMPQQPAYSISNQQSALPPKRPSYDASYNQFRPQPSYNEQQPPSNMPPLPPKVSGNPPPQQSGIPSYNNPSAFNMDMYSYAKRN